MKIQKTDNNFVNTKGKFIFSKNLSQKEIDLVNKINNTVKNNTTNIKILRKKPYNILISKSEKRDDLLELNTQFKDVWTNKETDCFISFIHKEDMRKDFDISTFRSSLNWFDYYKKLQGGYNNCFEKFCGRFQDIITY